VNVPFSIEHLVATMLGSVAFQLKFAIPSPFGSSGNVVSVGAVGGTVSIVHVRVAAVVPTFPAASTE
jgi:hypothetical protein